MITTEMNIKFTIPDKIYDCDSNGSICFKAFKFKNVLLTGAIKSSLTELQAKQSYLVEVDFPDTEENQSIFKNIPVGYKTVMQEGKFILGIAYIVCNPLI